MDLFNKGTRPGKSVCLTWIADRFYKGVKILDVYNAQDRYTNNG